MKRIFGLLGGTLSSCPQVIDSEGVLAEPDLVAGMHLPQRYPTSFPRCQTRQSAGLTKVPR